jgi:regulator of replication initiation timing
MASPGTPGGLSVARGFDRELTRDFAKRESALRFEVEKWRARAEALTEENETFRASVETARRRNADAEGHFALQSRELDRLRAQAVGEGAARAARLEEQCERQRRMLRELAVASEALAKDNVLLSSELVALRDRGDEAESLAETLSERLKSARRLYLANQKSLARAEETRSALPDGQWEKKLNELLTADVLARSKPPPAFPAEASDKARAPLVAIRAAASADGFRESNVASFGVAKSVPGSLVQERRKLHEENSALRKSLAKTQSLVTELREQKVLTAAELAAARRDSGAKARTAQAQLAGAARRLRWLVERVDALEASAREKDAYAASLEKRLLAQHRTMGEMTRAVGAETRRREARERSAKKNTRGKSGSPDSRSGDGDFDSGEKSPFGDEGGSPGRRDDGREKDSKKSGRALDSAVAFLKGSGSRGKSREVSPKSPEEKSAGASSSPTGFPRESARTDGWVPGAGGRTPTARDALRLARQAKVRTSSPSGEEAFDEGAVDDDESDESDGRSEADLETRLEMDAAARRVDFGFGVETPGAKEIAGSRAPSAAASPGTAPGTPGTNPGTPGTAPGTPGGPGDAEDGSGEDFSMDGIEAYIANLNALHRKSELAVKTPRSKR